MKMFIKETFSKTKKITKCTGWTEKQPIRLSCTSVNDATTDWCKIVIFLP